MGRVAGDFGCTLGRITKRENLLSDKGFADAIQFANDHPDTDWWGSLPCTPWSEWQHLNLKKGLKTRRRALALKMAKDRANSLELVRRYLVIALIVQRKVECDL